MSVDQWQKIYDISLPLNQHWARNVRKKLLCVHQPSIWGTMTTNAPQKTTKNHVEFYKSVRLDHTS